MPPKGAVASVPPMSPIEQHLVTRLQRALAVRHVPYDVVTVLSADADNWRYRVAAGDRTLEMGFNHRDRLWCREVTPGRERHLVSNDHPPVCQSEAGFGLGVRLIARAIADPTFPPRDPPVI